jgi:hypothetical protein
LLEADFPLDLCEADQSQTGKSFRMKLISQVHDERPFVVVMPSESKKGVGSLDESLSEALLSGQPFIVLENVRGEIASQLLESAIRGERKVAVRRAYSRTTQIETDHVFWMATSNRAQTTPDLANRSVITRLRKRPDDVRFTIYVEGNLLKHVEVRSDYYYSCIFSVIRHWHARGKPKTVEYRHDFREWSQTLDWIIQNIFGLRPLLDGHRGEQLRISSPGLSFLREVALEVDASNQCGEGLSATDIATVCDIATIDIPGCRPCAEFDQQSRRIGSLLGPLFKETGKVTIEGFEVTRTTQRIRLANRDEFRESRFCTVEKSRLK